MIIPDSKMKKMEVHPNVVIRKKLKSKAKLGKMMLEIYDEKIAGVYPTMDHQKRLKAHGIHQWTWDDAFREISVKKGKKVIVEISEEMNMLIQMAQQMVGAYKSLDATKKNLMEVVVLSLLRE